jgi:hypothetical protein
MLVTGDRRTPKIDAMHAQQKKLRKGESSEAEGRLFEFHHSIWRKIMSASTEHPAPAPSATWVPDISSAAITPATTSNLRGWKDNQEYGFPLRKSVVGSAAASGVKGTVPRESSNSSFIRR